MSDSFKKKAVNVYFYPESVRYARFSCLPHKVRLFSCTRITHCTLTKGLWNTPYSLENLTGELKEVRIVVTRSEIHAPAAQHEVRPCKAGDPILYQAKEEGKRL